jgi:predicted kinase
MIINIRGTSGSGKSTLVRSITELYERKFPAKVEGRRQPIGYVFTRPKGKTLAVIGHYETPCGGCDTITDQDEIYRRVRQSHEAGMDVLYEGLLISAETRRCIELHRDFPGYLQVVALDTPLDVCLASINERRRAKDPDKGDVNPKNTESKFKGVQSAVRKLKSESVPADWWSRDGARTFIKLLLGL